MAATPIRIVVADDSPLYRRTVRNILENQPNMQVVAEAGDGVYAIQAVKNTQTGCGANGYHLACP